MSIITSQAARNIRAIRAAAIVSARVMHYSKVAYATLAPIVKTALVFTLLVIIAIAVIALNFLTTNPSTETVSNANEVAQETENLDNMSLSELFQIADEIGKKYENFGNTTEVPQTTEINSNAKDDFCSMSVSRLRKIAQSRNIKGARNARKTELLTMLVQTH